MEIRTIVKAADLTVRDADTLPRRTGRTGKGVSNMDYGEGSRYQDDEMTDILMDASEREREEILRSEQAEADAEQDWLEEQAVRAYEQEA